MSLLRLQNISIAFGHVPILKNVQLALEKGERISLVGRNGEGKSTLLKIISGTLQADEGDIEKETSLKVGYLEQDLPSKTEQTVYDYVAEDFAESAAALKKYEALSLKLSDSFDESLMDEMTELQHFLDQKNAWQLDHRIQSILMQLALDPNWKLSTLSGGWCRRAAMARALLQEPDVLILDEPTNHLDIEMIEWLEGFLSKYRGAVLFVSHDRSFVHRLATRIIEIDRGILTSWQGGYQKYLEDKAHAIEVEVRQNALFDKKLSQEEVWIRQGVKARRTRNEGRVRLLKAMREERSQRREQKGRAKWVIDDVLRSGKLVVTLENISHSFDKGVVIQDFSTTVMRGDRVGLVGPNGIGKTTLLQIMTGELKPLSGKVSLGTNLSIAYFSQSRSELDEHKTLVDAVAGGQQELDVGGKKRHVISYLKDFLFEPERARSLVKVLSGGERNRLLLAKLFLKPSNLIIMDEPTNDLDVETLELLEERLIEYQGTLLVVSHDRAFLDNVITSTVVFEGEGKISQHVGGYSDWLTFREREKKESDKKLEPSKKDNKKTKPSTSSQKLSYHEERELKELPGKIETLENKLKELQEEIASPDFYKKSEAFTKDKLKTLQEIEVVLAECYERWESLERA